MKLQLKILYIGVMLVTHIVCGPIDDNISKPDNEEQLEVDEDCYQPKETGRCFALFHRFAFNVETNSCEEFIYGGCAGNKNNFNSKEECEINCFLKTEEPTTIIGLTTTPSI